VPKGEFVCSTEVSILQRENGEQMKEADHQAMHIKLSGDLFYNFRVFTVNNS